MANTWPETFKERRNWRERRTLDVSANIDGFLEKLDSKGALKFVKLWQNWPEVAGEEVASLARPLARRGRTLILEAEDPMVAQHLSFLVPELLGSINGFLGEHLIDDIRFELSNGRMPLDRKPQQTRSTPAPRIPERPEQLGGRMRELDPDDPVDRAYLAYIRMFEENEDTTG